MRLKFITTILAVPFLLFTACSDDDPVGGNPYPENPEGMITFTLSGVTKAVQTYADPIATDNENSVSTVDVYMFNDDSGVLEKIFKVDAANLGQVGTDLTATIDVTGRTGKRNFYFVANASGNASILEDVDAGLTTETEFKEYLTDRSQAAFLQNPLLMTAYSEIAAIETPTPTEKKVKLMRRVARFDIDNKAAETNFTISKILIQGARERGYIFADATGTPAQTIETGSLPAINYTDSANANIGMVGSIFYLYPTTLETTGTMISFEGVFNGETRLYSLKPGTPIEANKRYILKVKKIDINKPDLELTAEDWGDAATTEEAKPEGNNATFSQAVLTGGTGIQVDGNNYDISAATAAGTITIPVQSFKKVATTARVTYLIGSAADLPGFAINTPEPTLTYALSYLQEYKIIIPKQTTPAPFHIQVEIVNEAFPEQREVYNIYGGLYPGTFLKPIVFGGIKWAPVNVGATEIGTANEVKYMGLLFQWGRNVGFPYNAGQGEITDTIMGPLDYITATTGEARDKFIITPDVEPRDWLTPQDGSLWSGEKTQGPCPDGWRMPAKADLEKIVAAYGYGYGLNEGKVIWDDTAKRGVVKADNGSDLLYFPAAGWRSWANGKTFNYNISAYSLSSDTNGASAIALDFRSNEIALKTGIYRAGAFPVRCVQY